MENKTLPTLILHFDMHGPELINLTLNSYEFRETCKNTALSLKMRKKWFKKKMVLVCINFGIWLAQWWGVEELSATKEDTTCFYIIMVAKELYKKIPKEPPPQPVNAPNIESTDDVLKQFHEKAEFRGLWIRIYPWEFRIGLLHSCDFTHL